MSRIQRLSLSVNRAVEFAVFFLGLSMALIVALQVFSRYVLNHSLFWSEELARFLLVWLTFLGASVAYRRRAHASIDVLFRRLPVSGQRTAVFGVHLCALFFSLILVYFGVQFAFFVRLQISPALYLPKWIPHSIVPISGIIFVLHATAFLAEGFRQEKASDDR